MFNMYVWETYLNAGGNTVVNNFQNIAKLSSTGMLPDYVERFHKEYCASEVHVRNTRNEVKDFCHDYADGQYLLEDGEYTIDSAMIKLYDFIKGGEGYSDRDVFECFSESIAYYTLFLFAELPELFVPYFFKLNYNVLECIAENFDIVLPSIPFKKDYLDRFFHYGRICEALLKFRETHHMSPYELCAFLYDFAPKYIGGIDSYIIKNVPEPKSAYFIGASQDDIYLEKEACKRTCWQCNPDARAGDMIVMYKKSPISAIDSVWRSVSVGFNDPFFYYYRCTYIADAVTISRINQKQMKTDPIISNLPIVKKNMQGINGVELLPSQYNYIMDLANANVPRLYYGETENNSIFMLEKDVENKLIKPLLEKLGFSNQDYTQQMYIEIGNHNHALVPDFVVMPQKTKGHYAAFSLIEAKLSIPNHACLEEVKTQARSYAKLLSVKYAIIVSKEKLWVTCQADDYADDVFSATWGELNNADVFSRLLKLIGRDAVK